MIVKLPDSYKQDFLASRTALTKARVRLFCLMAVGLYFLAAWMDVLLRPHLFKTEEIPLWGGLLLASFIILFLNGKAQTLRAAKLNAFLFSALLLFMLIKLGLIYAEYASTSASYYMLLLFLVSLILPWTPAEVTGIACAHAAAFSFYYQYALPARARVTPGPDPFWDGLILIAAASVMCAVIRKKETARDIENFVLLKEVEAKNEQIQSELELARLIHKTLIPESITTDRADITVSYLPVESIGGDYARFHFLGDDKLIFIICDVTGHGVPAALLVNRLHAEFESLAKGAGSPGALLKELHEFISRDFKEIPMYLTAFCGMLDFKNTTFLYSNYGHPPQYIYHARRHEVRRLSPQTTLLGLADQNGSVYESEIPFDRGDRIVLFTDGILEPASRKGEESVSETLESFLTSNDHLASHRFNQKLLEAMSVSEVENVGDDIFLLTIKTNG